MRFLESCELHLFENFLCKSTAFCLLAQVEMVFFLKETWIIFPKALERNKANDLLELYYTYYKYRQERTDYAGTVG